MKHKYYQGVLWLTILECSVAFTVALALWVNLVPLWIAMPDATQLTQFEKYTTSGYGFWAAMWAVPNYLMVTSSHVDDRRRWAFMAGCVYVLWWVFWWDEIWNGTWQWYVVLLYVPVRIIQVGGNFAYWWRGPTT